MIHNRNRYVKIKYSVSLILFSYCEFLFYSLFIILCINYNFVVNFCLQLLWQIKIPFPAAWLDRCFSSPTQRIPWLLVAAHPTHTMNICRAFLCLEACSLLLKSWLGSSGRGEEMTISIVTSTSQAVVSSSQREEPTC